MPATLHNTEPPPNKSSFIVQDGAWQEAERAKLRVLPVQGLIRKLSN